MIRRVIGTEGTVPEIAVWQNREASYFREARQHSARVIHCHWENVVSYRQGAKELIRGYQASYGDNVEKREAYEGLDILGTGDTSGVELINEYMKTVSADLPTLTRQWKQDVAGFFPNVPAFLAGEPESMWRHEQDVSDTVPIRIWVNCLPSGGNSPQEIYMRGAAICALAMLLSERRNMVRICPYADLADGSTRIGSLSSYELSNPLNLSEVCAALANPKTTRTVTYALGCALNARRTGGWLAGHCPQDHYSDAQCKADLGAGPDDIVIPAAFFGDEIIADPVGWLHKAIKPYYEGED